MGKRNSSSKRQNPANVGDGDEPAPKRRHIASINGDTYSSVSHSIAGGSNNNNYMLQVNYPHTSQGVPESLKRATAHAAFHNSADRRDPPRCHENTRLAVLKKILDWVEGQDQETKDYFVMWLYGPAGSGKSAIAQTIAERLHEKGMLLASYFFGRLDSSRNTSRSLIPTIAYQMARRLPDEVRERLSNVINRDQLIFTQCLEAQIKSLILFPLEPFIANGHFMNANTARAIVIDGLDECVNRKEQEDILCSLSAALEKHRLPFRVFIASRPELEIKDSFNSNMLNNLSTRLALADDYWADSDIRLFLTDKFQNIKQTHTVGKRLAADWPSDKTMQHLVRKSSGQFIYASTVVKFVKSPRHHPDRRLRTILRLRPPGKELPFADLDALYRHLFSAVDDWEKVSLILAFCILRTDSSNFSVDAIEAALGLEHDDCRLFLCDLGSIIDICEDHLGRYRTLTIYHASLQDFLLDKARSKEFHIDPAMGHARLSRSFLQFFQGSGPRGHTNGVDLTILLPHMARAHSSPELEEEILTFNSLRFLDHEFPPHLAYSIPDYLSGIKDLRLEGVTASYQKQERAFHDHLKKELRGYGEAPLVDFLLLCICSDDFFGAHGFDLKHEGETLHIFSSRSRSLWVETAWTWARPPYIEALKVAAKDIISEQSEWQTVTSAALYALSEAFVISAQKRLDYADPSWCLVYQKKKFFLDNCNRLLEKAVWSENLINYVQDLAFPLVLYHHPGEFCEIDNITHNYLRRMGIVPKQDYAFLSRQALANISKMAIFDDTRPASKGTDLRVSLGTFTYLLEKARRSEDLISDIQNLAMPLISDRIPWAVRSIDMACRGYLIRMGVLPKNS